MCTVHKQYSKVNQTRTHCFTVVPSACKSSVEALIHPCYWFVYDRSSTGLILWPFCSICGSRVTPTISIILILDRLWWLNLCVYLTLLRDAQIGGKTLFLGVFLRVFLEDISIWFSRMHRDLPSQTHVGIIQFIEDLNTTKKWRKGKFSLSLLELGHLYFPALRHQRSSFSSLLSPETTSATPWFSDLWTQTELHHQVS